MRLGAENVAILITGVSCWALGKRSGETFVAMRVPIRGIRLGTCPKVKQTHKVAGVPVAFRLGGGRKREGRRPVDAGIKVTFGVVLSELKRYSAPPKLCPLTLIV